MTVTNVVGRVIRVASTVNTGLVSAGSIIKLAVPTTIPFQALAPKVGFKMIPPSLLCNSTRDSRLQGGT